MAGWDQIARMDPDVRLHGVVLQLLQGEDIGEVNREIRVVPPVWRRHFSTVTVRPSSRGNESGVIQSSWRIASEDFGSFEANRETVVAGVNPDGGYEALETWSIGGVLR